MVDETGLEEGSVKMLPGDIMLYAYGWGAEAVRTQTMHCRRVRLLAVANDFDCDAEATKAAIIDSDPRVSSAIANRSDVTISTLIAVKRHLAV